MRIVPHWQHRFPPMRSYCGTNYHAVARFSLRSRCRFGFARDPETGCPMCACRDPPVRRCPDVRRCQTSCPNGHQVNPLTGCETCRCKPTEGGDSSEESREELPAHCRGRPMCMMFCQFGFQTGADGCPICRCNPPRTNEEIDDEGFEPESEQDEDGRVPAHCRDRPMCRMICPTGFQTGSDGCPICRCNRRPGQEDESEESSDEIPEHCRDRPMCRMHCSTGFQTGPDGCPICRCNPPRPTPDEVPAHCRGRPMCLMLCQYGFQKGEDGCSVCRCNPPPQPEVLEPREEEEIIIRRRCPRVRCTNRCQGGFERDDMGCRTCRCRTSVVSGPTRARRSLGSPPLDSLPTHCRPVQCLRACPLGTQLDVRGCPSCECVTGPGDQGGPRPDGCPAVRCLLHCPFGFKNDNNGCQ